MKLTAALVVGGTLVYAAAAPTGAQTPPDPPARASVMLGTPQSQGWIGVELLYELEAPGREVVRVGAVVVGGPADQAGVRAGDLVRTVNGEAPTRESLARFTTGLRPGAEVVLGVERDGVRHTFVLEAQSRTGRMVTAFPARVRPDSTLLRLDGRIMSMDSLRVRSAVRLDSVLRVGAVRGVVAGEARPAMSVVRLDTTRMLALQAGAARGTALEVTSGRPPRIIEVERGGQVRLLDTPAMVVTGQRAVAGAEFAALNPGLAGYFGVGEGLLALQVIQGTPAYEGGLRAGDVIVEVAGEAVTTVAELRAALDRGYRAPPVPVQVVREGERLRLTFDRQ